MCGPTLQETASRFPLPNTLMQLLVAAMTNLRNAHKGSPSPSTKNSRAKRITVPLEDVAPVNPLQVRKPPPRVCAAAVDDSDDDCPTLARSFGEICFDAGRHGLGFSKRRSWNEQGVGDRVVAGARDRAHVPGKASHVNRTCQRAFFWFDCNIQANRGKVSRGTR